MRGVWFCLCVLVSLERCSAARILGVFPCPSISHQVVFRAVYLELAARGHELVVITTDPAFPADKPHPNITEINTHDVSYEYWKSKLALYSERAGGAETSLMSQYEDQQYMFIDFFEIVMNTPEVRELVHDEKQHFDLILVELLIRPAQAFRHRFKAPVIGLSSFSSLAVTFDAIGVPTHPVLYPDYFIDNWVNPGLLDRINMIYVYIRQAVYEYTVIPDINKSTRKYFGEDTPCITEIETQLDMTFLNVNPIWDGIRPVPPSVVYIGGSHISPPKEISKELQSFLDSASRGVVYMSLGSNVKSSTLSSEKLQVFLRVFSKLPYDVLWKWETDQLPGKSDNVRIAKWLPQADLLKHPNIKVFITQGGLQSADEAIQAGVPLIGFPFFGDQDYNVAKFEIHGVGKAMRIETLSEDTLETAIKSVMEDDRYRRNMRRMSRLLADQPMSGLQRAVWWSEHVLRHGGGRHLRSPAAGVSAVTYFMLDAVAAIASAVLIVIAIVCFAVKKICCTKNKIKED